MSQEEMTQEEATLFEQVYAPAFVEKMAELGREIPDVDTLEHALELTARVKQAVQQDGTNSIKQANLAFRKAVGADIQESVTARENQTKAAARKLAADPGFRKLLTAARGS